MLSLAKHYKAGFLERPNRVEMIDARQFRQKKLNCYIDYPHVLTADLVVDDRQVLCDRHANVLQRLRLGGSLRPAPRKARNRRSDSLFGAVEYNLVLHGQPFATV